MFRDLLDKIKGNETGMAFSERQPLARAAFDRLEKRWTASCIEVEQQAIIHKNSTFLDGFTRSCVDEAVATAGRLREMFS